MTQNRKSSLIVILKLALGISAFGCWGFIFGLLIQEERHLKFYAAAAAMLSAIIMWLLLVRFIKSKLFVLWAGLLIAFLSHILCVFLYTVLLIFSDGFQIFIVAIFGISIYSFKYFWMTSPVIIPILWVIEKFMTKKSN